MKGIMMAAPYSKEFRREVLSACDSGKGTREVATHFDVSESWVRRIKQERRELGKTAPHLKRKRTPEWAVYTDQILEIYKARPDTTLNELKAELETELSTSTLCVALQKLKLTFKKKFSSQQNKNVKTLR
jgi:transposase